MRRIGYDADSQTYTFEDTADGSIWESLPGNRYGELRQISGPNPNRRDSDDQDSGWRPSSPVPAIARDSDWKYLAPFLLLVIVVLLLVFKAMGARFWPA
jgi:hypothetical protein